MHPGSDENLKEQTANPPLPPTPSSRAWAIVGKTLVSIARKMNAKNSWSIPALISRRSSVLYSLLLSVLLLAPFDFSPHSRSEHNHVKWIPGSNGVEFSSKRLFDL